jgi:hypothetical protein
LKTVSRTSLEAGGVPPDGGSHVLCLAIIRRLGDAPQELIGISAEQKYATAYEFGEGFGLERTELELL